MRTYFPLEFYDSKTDGKWTSDFINKKEIKIIITRLKKEFPTAKIKNLGVYTYETGPYTDLMRVKVIFKNSADEAFFLLKIPTIDFGTYL
jgi:hypothetical protein